ncbi:LysR family transcriptional regulator [Isoptericola sp. NPDC019693]|uniref:LysR family transcriptional regulator n=1 Tax=Isoptericola sp. NPDC019693 TaxID=3364009 RepID=UPI00379E9373
MADRLNPDALRYAQAVAQAGSFSAAAREVGVTQPALSNGIAKLEARLGERLFDRTARGVTATPFGAHLLPLVDRAVTALDDVDAEARRWNAPAADSIRMGVSPLIDPRIVGRAYRAVRDLCEPDPCQLVLREANMGELRDALAAGDLDVIVVPSVAPMPRFEHRVIDSEPVVLVEAEPETTGPAELADLAGKQLILMPDTCGLTAFTRDLLGAHDIAVRDYPGEAASYRVLEEWSALGLGSAMLPESKLTGPTTSQRKVLDDGVEVEIFYEAVWDPRSVKADLLRTLADGLEAPQPDSTPSH